MPPFSCPIEGSLKLGHIPRVGGSSPSSTTNSRTASNDSLDILRLGWILPAIGVGSCSQNSLSFCSLRRMPTYASVKIFSISKRLSKSEESALGLAAAASQNAADWIADGRGGLVRVGLEVTRSVPLAACHKHEDLWIERSHEFETHSVTLSPRDFRGVGAGLGDHQLNMRAQIQAVARIIDAAAAGRQVIDVHVPAEAARAFARGVGASPNAREFARLHSSARVIRECLTNREKS